MQGGAALRRVIGPLLLLASSTLTPSPSAPLLAPCDVQIRVGEDKFVHARIWAKLDGTSELHSAQGGKALGDEL